MTDFNKKNWTLKTPEQIARLRVSFAYGNKQMAILGLNRSLDLVRRSTGSSFLIKERISLYEEAIKIIQSEEA